MTAPDNGSPIPPDAISRHAMRLDELVNLWFSSYVAHPNDANEHLPHLLAYINTVAKDYGVLAMSVGLINSETNTYEHLSSFPYGKKAPAPKEPDLPSYPASTANVFSHLQPYLRLHGNSMSVGAWIIELFSIRRRHQKPGKSIHGPEGQRPEGIDESGPYIVTSKTIIDSLDTWLTLLAMVGFAGKCPHDVDAFVTPVSELKAMLSDDFFTSSEFRRYEENTSLHACIGNLAANAKFTNERPLSNVSLFFSPEYNTNFTTMKGSVALQILYKFFAQLPIATVRNELGLSSRMRSWADLDGGITLPSQLYGLLETKFPILEYLVIYLLYGGERRYLHHVMWPFFKTLAFHAEGQEYDRLSFPGSLLLTVQSDTSLDRTSLISRLSTFALLMRVALEPFSDVVFYGGMERERLRTLGRLEEKANAFLATSHELKNLVKLIPLADGKAFLLTGLRDNLLTISLPAADALDEIKDAALLAKAVQGRTNSGELCADYKQWMFELVNLACTIHLIEKLGPALVIDTPEQLRSWASALATRFKVERELERSTIPASFSVRCYFSVATLCALRNVLHHCSEPSVIRTENKPPTVVLNETGCGDITITLGAGPLPKAVLIINNDRREKVRGPQGGTLDAINFFHGRIPVEPALPKCTNTRENGMWICRLPIPC